MLPPTIIIELFDLSRKATEQSIQHIADLVEDLGLRVDQIDDFDTAIHYKFSKHGVEDCQGLLVLDRVREQYSIDGGAPTRNLETVLEHLQMINESAAETQIFETALRSDDMGLQSRLNSLDINARELLMDMLTVYEDTGRYLFTMSDINGSASPESLGDLLLQGYVAMAGTDIKLDRNAADSLRAARLTEDTEEDTESIKDLPDRDRFGSPEGHKTAQYVLQQVWSIIQPPDPGASGEITLYDNPPYIYKLILKPHPNYIKLYNFYWEMSIPMTGESAEDPQYVRELYFIYWQKAFGPDHAEDCIPKEETGVVIKKFDINPGETPKHAAIQIGKFISGMRRQTND